jgi:hypothetical protein
MELILIIVVLVLLFGGGGGYWGRRRGIWWSKVFLRNISSGLLHSITDPSARPFVRLVVLTAIMMMGYLFILKQSQRVQIVQHNFSMVADRSKAWWALCGAFSPRHSDGARRSEE